ncbi:hypothetical protein BST81_17715 [Leptolyngbya sp. 'hensonii']|uniref:hybrid sensor histidine kinase/response regulator n=1 Tax=Leptolyngbya sp. 'hensonii' TaxID=1922337 RepID=UPI00094FC257|nr:response regulator [Leptolyngbya sp. 'hensonii']OLP17186.1 hypothetical protein BST81_17715 [Leptolyngbya sp. 'hensonii']
MLPEQQQRIMGYFIEEAKDHLNTIEQGLLNLQSTIAEPEMINEVFRAAHSVKGGAAMLGISSIQKTAHRLEDYFKILKEEQRPIKIDQKLESLFLRVFDTLNELLEQLQGPFGLSEDVANGIMANAEPVFEQLHHHLEALVDQTEGSPTPAAQPVWMSAAEVPQPVVTPPAATPATVFQSDVPNRLRDILQLFKQPETAETRQQLQGLCEALKQCGDQFNLAGWCELLDVTRQVLGNSANPYRTLAPIVIKELKQAQDLVLAGRSAEIACSQKLRELLPLTAAEAPQDLDDLFAEPSPVAAVGALDSFAESAALDSFDLTGLIPSGSDGLDQVLGDDLGDDLAIEQPGPEVGMAELNSLADLFEGEALDLGSTWQEEEVLGEMQTTLQAPDVPEDFGATGDFSDLLGGDLSNGAESTADQGDDLADLFGDDDFLGNATAHQAGPTMDQLDPAAQLDDLLGDDSFAEALSAYPETAAHPSPLADLGELFGELDVTDMGGSSPQADGPISDSAEFAISGLQDAPLDDLDLFDISESEAVSETGGNSFALSDFLGDSAALEEPGSFSQGNDDLGDLFGLSDQALSDASGSDLDDLFEESQTTAALEGSSSDDLSLDELEASAAAVPGIPESLESGLDLDLWGEALPESAAALAAEQAEIPVHETESVLTDLDALEFSAPGLELADRAPDLDNLFGDAPALETASGDDLFDSPEDNLFGDAPAPETASGDDLFGETSAVDVALGDSLFDEPSSDPTAVVEDQSLEAWLNEDDVTGAGDFSGSLDDLFGEETGLAEDSEADLDELAGFALESPLDKMVMPDLPPAMAVDLNDSLEQIEDDLEGLAPGENLPDLEDLSGPGVDLMAGQEGPDLDDLFGEDSLASPVDAGASEETGKLGDLDDLFGEEITAATGGDETLALVSVGDAYGLADLDLSDATDVTTPSETLITDAEAGSGGDEFDDLEALLGEAPAAAVESAPRAATPEIDDFADLEALLGDSPIAAEPSMVPLQATSYSAAPSAPEAEFDDLEKLLEDADKTMGGTPTVKPGRGGAPPVRRPRPATLVDQTMRVPVKQLDNLSNLVGELVVNRNSLEQDQERLRQFLDNLLYQVQQLSDVGQRMRDLYERSLLESSLLASRQSYYASGTSQTSHSTGASFDALEMDRFTGFHSLSQEMIELIVRVRESSSDIEFIIDETDQVTRNFRQVTTQLQEGLTRARMVPFSQTADRLPRGVRDNAIEYGKQAELIIEGRETLIDKMILEKLIDPLTHLVNNAVAHGVERPEVRMAAGKPATGKITVRAFYQGNQTVISVSDDGAGIDPERIKAKAIEKGLITPAEARGMSRLDVYDILFLPGFSGADQVTKIAGRGVGMDVVRTNLNEIRGAVSIDSNIGRGTTFTIRLPLTLSISKALCCISNRARIAFPMDGVEDMLDVPRERIQTNANGQPCILWRDMMLPFQSLSDVLKYSRYLGRGSVYGGNQEDDIVSIVVLRSAGNFIALQVDQVLGEQEIVIKQLEGPVPKPIGVAGATVLGDGRIMPIADVLELIDLVQGRIRHGAGPNLWDQNDQPAEPVVTAAEPTVLIVDDSITVRELLSMTFNKVGYRVEQARDGQEAWEKLRSGLPCDMVFCDIEMPRMDGLELLSRIQKDPTLNHLPIAMLTSRGADRHRQMAIQLGARGYFTKPYLEEALLDAAQRMLKGEILVAAG